MNSIFPLWHVKLRLMKQFAKVLPKYGKCSNFLCISNAKLKEGVFAVPDVRKRICDDKFVCSMNAVEHGTWLAFKNVVTNFLRNKKG